MTKLQDSEKRTLIAAPRQQTLKESKISKGNLTPEVSSSSPRRKVENKLRQSAPEFSSEEDGVNILHSSWVNNIDRIRMRVGGMSCATGPREGRRHAVSKLRKIATVEDSKRSNIATDCERWKAIR